MNREKIVERTKEIRKRLHKIQQLEIRYFKSMLSLAFISPQEKEDVLKKSGGICAHCGKPIYIGYQFSVDHYIPLTKGGVNRSYNLVPLCKECNKKERRQDI